MKHPVTLGRLQRYNWSQPKPIVESHVPGKLLVRFQTYLVLYRSSVLIVLMSLAQAGMCLGNVLRLCFETLFSIRGFFFEIVSGVAAHSSSTFERKVRAPVFLCSMYQTPPPVGPPPLARRLSSVDYMQLYQQFLKGVTMYKIVTPPVQGS